MNEQLLQVIKFLFVPEATLAVVFFVIFLLILVSGVIIYRRNRDGLIAFREQALEDYDKVSQKTPPEIFLKKRLERLSAGEGMLEGIPDVFVSVGILATFIGLGIAIQEAAGLLTAEKFEIEKMVGLLGIIAFKFQTSVWGIAFSLLFRRFAVENYFAFRQEVIDEIRELLYVMERDSVQRLLEKQNIFLDTMLAYRRQADKDFNSRLVALVKDINERQEALLDKQREQGAAQHEEMLAGIKSLQAAQTAGIDGVKGALTTIFERQDAIAKAQKAETDRRHESRSAQIDALAAALAAGEVTRKAALSEFTALRQRFDSFEGVTEHYAQTAKDFEGQVAAFGGQVETFRQEIFTMQKNIAAALEEINAKTQDNLVAMQSHVENLQKVFLRDENQYVAKTREYFQNILQQSEDAFKNILNDSISNVHESYARELARFANITTGLDSVLAKIDTHVAKMHKEMIAGQKAVEAMAQTSCQDLNSLIGAVGDSAKAYQRNLSAVHDRMNTSVAETVKLQEGLLDKQEKLLQGFTVAFARDIKALQEVQTTLREGMLLAIGALNEDIKTTFGDMQKTMAECGDMRKVDKSLQEFKADMLRVANVHSKEAKAQQTALPAQMAAALQGGLPTGEIIAALNRLNEKQDAAIALESKINAAAEQMLLCLRQAVGTANRQPAAVARKTGAQPAENFAPVGNRPEESVTSRWGKSIKETISSLQKMVETGTELPPGGDKK